MTDIINLFYKWQTLIGSILGGIFALCVALIVGHAVRRREELSSGMLLIAELMNVRIAFETLIALAEKENISEDDYPFWFAGKLTGSFPKLSPLFEASIVRMMPINTYLAAHLTLFHKIHTKLQMHIERIIEDFRLHNQGELTRPKDQLKADARIIQKHYPIAVQHAKCSEQLISDFVLSKFPTWHRLRKAVRLRPDEKDCIKYLTEGS